jgi:hypothetical protein
VERVQPLDLDSSVVVLKAISGGDKIKIWDSSTKGGTPVTLPATYETYEELWVEGVEVSSEPCDVTLALEYTIGGKTFDDQINVTVVKFGFKNPVDPTKDEVNDSDDFFFRGPSENAKLYYDILPVGTPVQNTKLKITHQGTTHRTIDLQDQTGENILVEWDCKNAYGQYFTFWEFELVLEADISEETWTDEHIITDLLYKHRPSIYTCSGEFSGPLTCEFMMDHADLYLRIAGGSDDQVVEGPLSFGHLEAFDDTFFYQDMDDAYRQSGSGTPIVYCRGVVDSGHAFLQYWHFEPSSALPYLPWQVLFEIWHEGDWEMFQIAAKLDQENEEI